ncbi:MAG: TonB-dependent receptor [Bacteroidaceae bacterium]
MKKITLLLLVTLLTLPTWADNIAPKDTTRVVDIEEVLVIGSPKETTKLRQLPTSVSLLSQKEMQAQQINSLKNISGIVPNFYMPDYGSRLTSAIYIRGVGARINTPAVGLYVDNIPYVDKSAFDFNFFDIERIDILRGPQGTLYGRNTMGGLIKVHTKSPFSYQGTDVKLSAGTYNNYSASATHYHRWSDKFAFSAGGFYEYGGGFFKNTTLNKKVDPLSAGGGRMRAIWLPNENLKFDFTVGYEYNDQGGYAYGLYHKDTEVIDPVGYDKESSYRRGLLNAGLNIEYQAKNFTLNAVTGYQNLNDRMFMDQDFSPRKVYTIMQKQRLNSVTEEITLKSKPGKNWQWVTGAFGFYQALNTDGPVTFREDGVKTMIEGNINKVFKNIPMPQMNMKINNETLSVEGNYDTPVMSAAVYHQSTYNNLFVKGLSVTLGLRLDYEKTKLDYNASTSIDYAFNMNMGQMKVKLPLVNNSVLKGNEKTDYLQVLPKAAIKYDFNATNSIYISASKGYRSGGYNIQMFSDLISSTMQTGMMKQVKEGSKEYILALNIPGMTPDRVDQMLSKMPIKETNLNIKEAVTYKPEFTWSYELGTHLSMFSGKFTTDLTAFYMDIRDQQIAKFAENGLGRITVNAGRSRSLGAEMAFRASITKSFNLYGSYGYTHATFTDYLSNQKNEKGELVTVDLKGNFVPMTPRNTFSIGADYTFAFNHRIIKSVVIDAQYNGAGKILWTERNDVKQDLYGILNARATLNLCDLGISLWAKNALNTTYSTFYFETIGDVSVPGKAVAGFMQLGKPMQLGIDLRYRF